ncbi:MAG: hypothetical protein ACI82F_002717 [Planctomycetota bacterium]
MGLNPNRALGNPFLLYMFPDDNSGVVALDVSNWDHGAATLDFDRKDYEAQGEMIHDQTEIQAFAIALRDHQLDRTRPGWRAEVNILTGEPIAHGVESLPGRLMRVERLEVPGPR